MIECGLKEESGEYYGYFSFGTEYFEMDRYKDRKLATLELKGYVMCIMNQLDNLYFKIREEAGK